MKVNEILNEETTPEFTGKFPYCDKILSNPNAKPDKWIGFNPERWTETIGQIRDALDAKEIVNTQLETVKSRVNKYVEAVIKTGIAEPFYYAGNWESLPQDLQHVDYPYGIANIPAYQKKLAKVSTESKKSELWKTANEIVTELMDLVKVMVFLKSHVVKASVKKREAIEARKNEEGEYNKKFTDHKDVKKVVELLKKKANSIEDDVYKSTLEGLQDIVDMYKKKIKDEGHTDYTELFKHSPYYRVILQSVTKRTDGGSYYTKQKEFKLNKDYKTTLEEMARKHADEVINHFVHKNANKISYVLYNKNNLKSVSIDNVNVRKGVVECEVNCKFEDGSSFIAHSSVVYATSKLGKWFYRYPTLFKAVVMPDGSRMSGATEKKMDEVFAITK